MKKTLDPGASALASPHDHKLFHNTLVGVDFAGPGTASGQRRKIVAIAAQRVGKASYRVAASGFNARVAGEGPPGWTALELAEALTGPARAGLVACDFPFSLPAELLRSPALAADVCRSAPFNHWCEFNTFVAHQLPLRCPVDLSRFAGWKRDTRYWRKRATDIAAGAQPPLKHRYQVLFNMTLLGNALLARLRSTGLYRVDPFDADDDEAGVLLEVYPGATMRRLGKSNYKREPSAAIQAILEACRDRGIAVAVDPRVRARCETYGMTRKPPDPDASDALIAACTAVLLREGYCERLVGDGAQDRIAVEGAIWALRV